MLRLLCARVGAKVIHYVDASKGASLCLKNVPGKGDICIKGSGLGWQALAREKKVSGFVITVLLAAHEWLCITPEGIRGSSE